MKHITKPTALVLAVLLLAGSLKAQVTQLKVGDNPTTATSSSALEIESTNKGLLLPRVALSATTTPTLVGGSHLAGMTVYNTATVGDVTPGYYYDNGTAWHRLADTTLYTGDGTLTGNRIVAQGTNTLNFSGTGNVGIGTSVAPAYKLVVDAGSQGFPALFTTSSNRGGIIFANTTTTNPYPTTEFRVNDVAQGGTAVSTQAHIVFVGGNYQDYSIPATHNNMVFINERTSSKILFITGDANNWSTGAANVVMTLTNKTVGINITTTTATSALQVVGLKVYATDAAAGTDGLTTGAFYLDSGGLVHAKQ